MKNIVSVLSLAALVAGSLFAQEKPAAPAVPAAPASPAAPVAPDAVVISAEGGISVRRAEFEEAVKGLPPQYQQYIAGPGKKQFAEEFLRMKLLAVAGAKAGLENDPEVKSELARLRENVIASAWLKKTQAGTTVDEAELRKVYEARKAEFEKVKARHILIAFKGSQAAQASKPALTEEQAKAKAEELRAKIEKGEAKFEDVAKAESDDVQSGAAGGDLGEFGRGQMMPEFEQAAFATETGKISPVIRTDYGYHLIKAEEHATTSFEEAKPALDKAARTAKIQESIDKLVQESKPTFDPAYFGQ